jgi:calcineurin-like phosphoesterase family protein
MFVHYNPLINRDHYNYFVRCVDRFKNLLQKQEHKLFIMTFVNMNNIDENIKIKVIEFNNKFSKYTYNYTLLVIFHIPNKEQNHNCMLFRISNYHQNENFQCEILFL